MQASDFEFRNRFWVIGGIFFVAFGCYAFDRINVVVALFQLAGRGAREGAAGLITWAHVAFFAGALMIALSSLVRTWATAYLKVAVVQDHALHSEGLVADGPFRYVRNPLYLATILMSLGVAPMTSRVGFVVLVAAMLVFHLRLIGREEAGLAAAQGESYRAYCRAVPRLVPALRPRVPDSGARGNWKEGFIGEIAFWTIALGAAIFALTLHAVWYWVLVALAFPLQSVCIALANRGTRPTPDPR